MKTNIDNLNVSNPFTVPDEYFSGLEKAILLQTAEKELNPFKTPDSYFETLETSIISQTSGKKKAENTKIIPLFSKKLYWISAAACIFFALMIGVYTYTNSSKENTTIASKETEKAVSVLEDTYAFNSEEKENALEVSLPPENVTESRPEITKNTVVKTVTYKKETIQPTEKTSEVIYNLYFDEGTDVDKEEEFLL